MTNPAAVPAGKPDARLLDERGMQGRGHREGNTVHRYRPADIHSFSSKPFVLRYLAISVIATVFLLRATTSPIWSSCPWVMATISGSVSRNTPAFDKGIDEDLF